MALYVIYNTLHWMDKLKPEDLAKRLLDKNFAEKYATRNRPGDIISVHPSPKNGIVEPVSPGSVMALVSIPEESVETARQFKRPILDYSVNPLKPTVVKKCKFNFDMAKLQTINKETITETLDTKELTIPLFSVLTNNLIVEKTL